MSGCSDCNTLDAKEQCDADGVPEFLVNHSQTVATACEDVLGIYGRKSDACRALEDETRAEPAEGSNR
jgi:hypothetical protein